ncbi:acyl-CoA dehydrogenase [Rhodovibrionaceae bacterium A322]
MLMNRDIDFLMFDWLNLNSISNRPDFISFDRETSLSIISTAMEVARDHFAPHNALADANEPDVVNGKVVMRPEVETALSQFIEAGFMGLCAPEDWGGLQQPFTLQMAVGSVFSAANVSTMGYPFLTMAAANVLESFGSDEQKHRFMQPMYEGRFFGTMALTEPQAGSSLSDIRTKAVPQPDGSYRLQGNKIFISAGDHELSDNIVHLVLAKIEGAPAGVKGISLFIVPKFLVQDDGSLGPRNDVALGGLIHKMGYRGTTSTLLNFGENDGAVGYLVGEPHQGLRYMFQMMNEARISVGNGAMALGLAGYQASLAYARERLQGRAPLNKDPNSAQQPLIAHADIRRMLLAQKAYVEGAQALCLFAASLVDEEKSAPEEQARTEANLLLELLTPIVKSWPSQWCLEANAQAIQIHGGYGYTRDYPVEQIYRDNRLNPIHEGTHGIQALDLLGRKVHMAGGKGFSLLQQRVSKTLDQAQGLPDLAGDAATLAKAQSEIQTVTELLCQRQADGLVNEVLGNASPYLEALGHYVIAWIWLDLAVLAEEMLADRDGGELGQEELAFLQGKLSACRYFLRWELPKYDGALAQLKALDDSWFAAPEDIF